MSASLVSTITGVHYPEMIVSGTSWRCVGEKNWACRWWQKSNRRVKKALKRSAIMLGQLAFTTRSHLTYWQIRAMLASSSTFQRPPVAKEMSWLLTTIVTMRTIMSRVTLWWSALTLLSFPNKLVDHSSTERTSWHKILVNRTSNLTRSTSAHIAQFE